MKIAEIFKLSFEAIRERKARAALTIIMVLVGCSLMIALNGISAGQKEFIKKQLNTLHLISFLLITVSGRLEAAVIHPPRVLS